MERRKLLALGFVETKPNKFVLFKEEQSYDEQRKKTVWKKRQIGFIRLDEFGMVAEQRGFPEGKFLYRRINRPFGRR